MKKVVSHVAIDHGQDGVTMVEVDAYECSVAGLIAHKVVRATVDGKAETYKNSPYVISHKASGMQVRHVGIPTLKKAQKVMLALGELADWSLDSKVLEITLRGPDIGKKLNAAFEKGLPLEVLI